VAVGDQDERQHAQQGDGAAVGYCSLVVPENYLYNCTE
jgi:hypothetical protein